VGIIEAGQTSATFTTDWTTTSYNVHITGLSIGDSFSLTMPNKLQLETGSQPTSYEPYTGGIPAPSPSYPMPINVVNGVQTVEVHGKNRMPLEMVDFDDVRVQNFAIDLPEGTNTISFDLDSFSMGTNNSFSIAMQLKGSNGGDVAALFFPTVNPSTTLGRKSYTFTSTGDASIAYNSNIRIPQTEYDNGARAVLSNIQIETGSTSSTYQPFQSQSYTVDLGSIELCKIGDYQDYIYKSGNDWYMHKEIAKYTFTGTETWETSPYGTNSWRLINVISFPFDTNELQIISNIFTGIKHIDRNTEKSNLIYSGSNTEFDIRNTSLTSLAEVQAATNGNYVYYALATPTDTKITDVTLIGQLDALNSAALPKPTALIELGATGTNLTPYLTIAYYGSDEE
jgi:hypothetical protein